MKDRFGFDWSGIAGQPFWARPVIGRRVFFRHAAAALGGYLLLPTRPGEAVAKAAVATKNTARNCIFILLQGAPSHVDTFDLKEGPWTPASFNPTWFGDLRFPQGLMPSLAEQISDLALVRSVRAPAVVHGLMQAWVQIGRNPASALGKLSPHIGSVVSMERSETGAATPLPAFVALNGTPVGGAGYFPPIHAPFEITAGAALANIQHRDGAARFDTRFTLLQSLDAEMRATNEIGAGSAEMAEWNLRARQLMYNRDVENVFLLNADERARYGNNGFGNACLVARNLIRANLGTRFVQISFGGWDHHSNIYPQLTTMSGQFDLGLANLMKDLKDSGLFEQTLIVAMGEFGRTVGALNVSRGRDHHPQQSVLFTGGGVRGGRAIGSTNELGSLIADPGWARNREIHAEDIEATIYTALGIDWTTVRRDDPFGRGFEYVPFSDRDVYGPINELFG